MSNSTNKQTQKTNNKTVKEVNSMPSTTKAYMSYLKDEKGNYIADKDGHLIPTSMIFIHNGKRYVTMLLEQTRKYRDKKTGEVKVSSYYDVHIYDAKDEKAENDEAL